MSFGDDIGGLTEGFLPGSTLSMLTEGLVDDLSYSAEALLAIEALTQKFYRMMLREHPEDVYADSGEFVDIDGVLVPKELHKRLLLVDAEQLAKAHYNMIEIGLESNVKTCTEATIGDWELRFLGEQYPGDGLDKRRNRVSRIMALRGRLDIEFLQRRISEIIGYWPPIDTFTDIAWVLGQSELGVDTFLAGLEFHYVVRLLTLEDQSTLDEIDRLLTRIEPARCTHSIENQSQATPGWRLGQSGLGIGTYLG